MAFNALRSSSTLALSRLARKPRMRAEIASSAGTLQTLFDTWRTVDDPTVKLSCALALARVFNTYRMPHDDMLLPVLSVCVPKHGVAVLTSTCGALAKRFADTSRPVDALFLPAAISAVHATLSHEDNTSRMRMHAAKVLLGLLINCKYIPEGGEDPGDYTVKADPEAVEDARRAAAAEAGKPTLSSSPSSQGLIKTRSIKLSSAQRRSLVKDGATNLSRAAKAEEKRTKSKHQDTGGPVFSSVSAEDTFSAARAAVENGLVPLLARLLKTTPISDDSDSDDSDSAPRRPAPRTSVPPLSTADAVATPGDLASASARDTLDFGEPGPVAPAREAAHSLSAREAEPGFRHDGEGKEADDLHGLDANTGLDSVGSLHGSDESFHSAHDEDVLPGAKVKPPKGGGPAAPPRRRVHPLTDDPIEAEEIGPMADPSEDTAMREACTRALVIVARLPPGSSTASPELGVDRVLPLLMGLLDAKKRSTREMAAGVLFELAASDSTVGNGIAEDHAIVRRLVKLAAGVAERTRVRLNAHGHSMPDYAAAMDGPLERFDTMTATSQHPSVPRSDASHSHRGLLLADEIRLARSAVTAMMVLSRRSSLAPVLVESGAGPALRLWFDAGAGIIRRRALLALAALFEHGDDLREKMLGLGFVRVMVQAVSDDLAPPPPEPERLPATALAKKMSFAAHKVASEEMAKKPAHFHKKIASEAELVGMGLQEADSVTSHHTASEQTAENMAGAAAASDAEAVDEGEKPTRRCARAICALADAGAEAVEHLLACGALPAIVLLATRGETVVRRDAGAALRAMACHSVAVEPMVEGGAVEELLFVVSHARGLTSTRQSHATLTHFSSMATAVADETSRGKILDTATLALCELASRPKAHRALLTAASPGDPFLEDRASRAAAGLDWSLAATKQALKGGGPSYPLSLPAGPSSQHAAPVVHGVIETLCAMASVRANLRPQCLLALCELSVYPAAHAPLIHHGALPLFAAYSRALNSLLRRECAQAVYNITCLRSALAVPIAAEDVEVDRGRKGKAAAEDDAGQPSVLDGLSAAAKQENSRVASKLSEHAATAGLKRLGPGASRELQLVEAGIASALTIGALFRSDDSRTKNLAAAALMNVGTCPEARKRVLEAGGLWAIVRLGSNGRIAAEHESGSPERAHAISNAAVAAAQHVVNAHDQPVSTVAMAMGRDAPVTSPSNSGVGSLPGSPIGLLDGSDSVRASPVQPEEDSDNMFRSRPAAKRPSLLLSPHGLHARATPPSGEMGMSHGPSSPMAVTPSGRHSPTARGLVGRGRSGSGASNLSNQPRKWRELDGGVGEEDSSILEHQEADDHDTVLRFLWQANVANAARRGLWRQVVGDPSAAIEDLVMELPSSPEHIRLTLAGSSSLAGARAARFLLALEEDPKSCSYDRQLSCVRFLAALCAGSPMDSEEVRSIADRRTIDVLVSLATSPHPRVRLAALSVVAELSRSDSIATAMTKQGAVAAIWEAMLFPDLPIAVRAATTLARLSRLSGSAAVIATSGNTAVPLLRAFVSLAEQLLQSEHPTALTRSTTGSIYVMSQVAKKAGESPTARVRPTRLGSVVDYQTLGGGVHVLEEGNEEEEEEEDEGEGVPVARAAVPPPRLRTPKEHIERTKVVSRGEDPMTPSLTVVRPLPHESLVNTVGSDALELLGESLGLGASDVSGGEVWAGGQSGADSSTIRARARALLTRTLLTAADTAAFLAAVSSEENTMGIFGGLEVCRRLLSLATRAAEVRGGEAVERDDEDGDAGGGAAPVAGGGAVPAMASAPVRTGVGPAKGLGYLAPWVTVWGSDRPVEIDPNEVEPEALFAPPEPHDATEPHVHLEERSQGEGLNLSLRLDGLKARPDTGALLPVSAIARIPARLALTESALAATLNLATQPGLAPLRHLEEAEPHEAARIVVTALRAALGSTVAERETALACTLLVGLPRSAFASGWSRHWSHFSDHASTSGGSGVPRTPAVAGSSFTRSSSVGGSPTAYDADEFPLPDVPHPPSAPPARSRAIAAWKGVCTSLALSLAVAMSSRPGLCEWMRSADILEMLSAAVVTPAASPAVREAAAVALANICVAQIPVQGVDPVHDTTSIDSVLPPAPPVPVSILARVVRALAAASDRSWDVCRPTIPPSVGERIQLATGSGVTLVSARGDRGSAHHTGLHSGDFTPRARAALLAVLTTHITAQAVADVELHKLQGRSELDEDDHAALEGDEEEGNASDDEPVTAFDVRHQLPPAMDQDDLSGGMSGMNDSASRGLLQAVMSSAMSTGQRGADLLTHHPVWTKQATKEREDAELDARLIAAEREDMEEEHRKALGKRHAPDHGRSTGDGASAFAQVNASTSSSKAKAMLGPGRVSASTTRRVTGILRTGGVSALAQLVLRARTQWKSLPSPSAQHGDATRTTSAHGSRAGSIAGGRAADQSSSDLPLSASVAAGGSRMVGEAPWKAADTMRRKAEELEQARGVWTSEYVREYLVSLMEAAARTLAAVARSSTGCDALVGEGRGATVETEAARQGGFLLRTEASMQEAGIHDASHVGGRSPIAIGLRAVLALVRTNVPAVRRAGAECIARLSLRTEHRAPLLRARALPILAKLASKPGVDPISKSWCARALSRCSSDPRLMGEGDEAAAESLGMAGGSIVQSILLLLPQASDDAEPPNDSVDDPRGQEGTALPGIGEESDNESGEYELEHLTNTPTEPSHPGHQLRSRDAVQFRTEYDDDASSVAGDKRALLSARSVNSSTALGLSAEERDEIWAAQFIITEDVTTFPCTEWTPRDLVLPYRPPDRGLAHVASGRVLSRAALKTLLPTIRPQADDTTSLLPQAASTGPAPRPAALDPTIAVAARAGIDQARQEVFASDGLTQASDSKSEPHGDLPPRLPSADVRGTGGSAIPPSVIEAVKSAEAAGESLLIDVDRVPHWLKVDTLFGRPSVVCEGGVGVVPDGVSLEVALTDSVHPGLAQPSLAQSSGVLTASSVPSLRLPPKSHSAQMASEMLAASSALVDVVQENEELMSAMELGGDAAFGGDDTLFEVPMFGKIDENVAGITTGALVSKEDLRLSIVSPFAYAHPSLSPTREPKRPGSQGRLHSVSSKVARAMEMDGGSGSIVGFDPDMGVIFDVQELRDALIVAATSERLGMGGVGVRSALGPSPIGIARQRPSASDPGAKIVPPAYEALARSGALSGYTFAAVPSNSAAAALGQTGASQLTQKSQLTASTPLLAPHLDPSRLSRVPGDVVNVPLESRKALERRQAMEKKERQKQLRQQIMPWAVDGHEDDPIVAGVPVVIDSARRDRMDEDTLRMSLGLRRKAAAAAAVQEERQRRREEARKNRQALIAERKGQPVSESKETTDKPVWRGGGTTHSRAPPEAEGIGGLKAPSASQPAGDVPFLGISSSAPVLQSKPSSAQLARQQAQEEAQALSNTVGDSSANLTMPRPRPALSPLRARPSPAVVSHLRRAEKLRAEMGDYSVHPLDAFLASTQPATTSSSNVPRVVSSAEEWARSRAASALARREEIEAARRARAEEEKAAMQSSKRRKRRLRKNKAGRVKKPLIGRIPSPEFAGDGSTVSSLQPGAAPRFRGEDSAEDAAGERSGAAILAAARAKAQEFDALFAGDEITRSYSASRLEMQAMMHAAPRTGTKSAHGTRMPPREPYKAPAAIPEDPLVSMGTRWQEAKRPDQARERPAGRHGRDEPGASLVPAMSRAASYGFESGARGDNGTMGPRQKLSSTMSVASLADHSKAAQRARDAEAKRVGGSAHAATRPVDPGARAMAESGFGTADEVQAAAAIAAMTSPEDRAIIDKGLRRAQTGAGADAPIMAGSAVPPGVLDAPSLDAALGERAMTGISRPISKQGPAKPSHEYSKPSSPGQRKSQNKASVREAMALFEETSRAVAGESDATSPPRVTRIPSDNSLRRAPLEYSLGQAGASATPGIRAEVFEADAKARAERPDIPSDRRLRPWASAQAEADALAKQSAEKAADKTVQRARKEAVAAVATKDIDAATARADAGDGLSARAEPESSDALGMLQSP
jgi:hypothetical protein